MSNDQVPYVILKRSLEQEADESPSPTTIFICLNLLDHTIVGIGLDRESALQSMVDASIIARRDAKRARRDAKRISSREQGEPAPRTATSTSHPPGATLATAAPPQWEVLT